MGNSPLSIDEAREAAREPAKYLIWVKQRQAQLFTEPGWVKLEPPRDGAVLFLHRERKIRDARRKGVL
jgi:hypothetical protein